MNNPIDTTNNAKKKTIGRILYKFVNKFITSSILY